MSKKIIVGYIPGCWDILHAGHLNILEKAKSVCDILVVGCPSDEVVIEDKGKPPIIPHDQRVRMLEALKCVDTVLLYRRLDFIREMEAVDADVLIVGSTWGKDERHQRAEAFIEQKDGKVIQFQYTDGVSTTQIKEKIINQHTEDQA